MLKFTIKCECGKDSEPDFESTLTAYRDFLGPIITDQRMKTPSFVVYKCSCGFKKQVSHVEMVEALSNNWADIAFTSKPKEFSFEEFSTQHLIDLNKVLTEEDLKNPIIKDYLRYAEKKNG